LIRTNKSDNGAITATFVKHFEQTKQNIAKHNSNNNQYTTTKQGLSQHTNSKTQRQTTHKQYKISFLEGYGV